MTTKVSLSKTGLTLQPFLSWKGVSKEKLCQDFVHPYLYLLKLSIRVQWVREIEREFISCLLYIVHTLLGVLNFLFVTICPYYDLWSHLAVALLCVENPRQEGRGDAMGQVDTHFGREVR
jgi:hypothetical protein